MQPLVAPLNWYALHVRSNFERRVEAALSESGLEAFAPFRQPQQKDTPARPLFPGYLFSRFDPDQRIQALRTTGVIRILGFLGEPLAIPDVEIESVRRILTAPEIIEVPFIAAGDYVRIRKGPLQGIEGYVAFIKDKARVVVSVEMLHRSVSAEVDEAWLEPVQRKVGKVVQMAARPLVLKAAA